jgi:hypothetical protein
MDPLTERELRELARLYFKARWWDVPTKLSLALMMAIKIKFRLGD